MTSFVRNQVIVIVIVIVIVFSNSKITSDSDRDSNSDSNSKLRIVIGRLKRGCKHRKEPVRFDSSRFRTFRKLIGSVRFGSVSFPVSMLFGLHFSDASWLGPVRFGSVPRPVPAVCPRLVFTLFALLGFKKDGRCS